MKGLVFKELYLSRKTRIIDLVSAAGVVLICVLVRLSALYGNIGRLPEASIENAMKLTYYFMVFGTAVVLFAGQFATAVKQDEKSGWRAFSHTLPVTEKKIVGSVYILNALSLAVCTLLSWLVLFAADAVFDRGHEPKFMLYLFGIGCAVFLFSHAGKAVNYLIRDEKKASGIITLAALVIYFGSFFGIEKWLESYSIKKTGTSIFDESGSDASDGIMIGFYREELLGKLQWLGDNSWWLIPTVVLGLCALFYFLSVKGLGRRGAR